MRQPPLDHHMIVLHQGGPKRVRRDGGAGRRCVDVAVHANTTVEAGSAYRWRTEGPIAFAHLYVAPTHFAAIVGEAFDRDPASVSLAEAIGRPDPHVASLFNLMIASQHDPDWPSIGDCYLDALIVRLAATSTWGGEFRAHRRLTLTRHTIAKVRDFILGNLNRRITLDELADVAGYSRYHFVRAFKECTGLPPYGYVLQERVAVAQGMLRDTGASIAEIASRTGFATHTHFSTHFRRAVGLTPLEYRRRHRGATPGDAAMWPSEALDQLHDIAPIK